MVQLGRHAGRTHLRAAFTALMLLGLTADAGAAGYGPTQFVRAFEKARDGVVAVEARQGTLRRRGSGFVAAPNGLIVCASYTVERAESVRVHVGGVWQDARVLALEPEKRVALLQVSTTTPLRALAVAREAELKLGTWVVAVERKANGKAHPIAGTVSLVPDKKPSARGDIVMVDAPAMAGAPLVNLQGEVVGISLGGITKQRGRAISLAPVRDFLRQAASAAPTADAND
ncbi:MAG: serine protease [Myxococcota bacterium]